MLLLFHAKLKDFEEYLGLHLKKKRYFGLTEEHLSNHSHTLQAQLFFHIGVIFWLEYGS